MEFANDYPNARQILLNVNYRSSAHIVNGALRVIGHNKTRFDKEIAAKQKAGETIHVQEVKDPVEESRYVLERIQEYQSQESHIARWPCCLRTNWMPGCCQNFDGVSRFHLR